MAIVYSYKINAARVVSQGGLTDVIKEVEVTVTGTDGAAKFDLPTTITLGAADPGSFTAFGDLTEEQILAWLDTPPTSDALPGVPTPLEGIKAHIAYVVAKEVEKLAMEQKPLPWAPAPETPAPVAPLTAE
jgi:hypothetical protein